MVKNIILAILLLLAVGALSSVELNRLEKIDVGFVWGAQLAAMVWLVYLMLKMRNGKIFHRLLVMAGFFAVLGAPLAAIYVFKLDAMYGLFFIPTIWFMPYIAAGCIMLEIAYGLTGVLKKNVKAKRPESIG